MNPSPAVTALIAEDEELPRRDLQALLAELWPELELVAVTDNGDDALAALAEHAPQVAFLDIRMPGPSGLDVARAASGRCHVVFTTAYDQYAVDAFAAQAVDYVLKPVRRERLAETVERLRARLALRPQALPADLTPLIAHIERQLRPAAAPRLRFISASVGDTVKLFAVDEVLYFQSDEKYTRVVTADDEALIRKTLKELLAELDPERFWQVHRGTVVQVGAIARAARDGLGRIQLTLKARPDKLAVSQAYAWRFRGM
jgi:DNA-binding LytR/AlgR family response regulator